MTIELLTILGAAVAWTFVGVAVLSALDDEGGALLEWAKKNPFGGLGVFILVWPVSAVLVLWLRHRQ